MNKIYTLVLTLLPFAGAFSQVEGTWKIAPMAEALAVGPAMNDFSWWANSDGDVTTRSCFFDDEFVFEADGSFKNVLGDDTWLEQWQGVDPPECGTPIAPHNGSNAASWTYDDAAGTITLDGVGAYLGLPKVINGGELASPGDAPASITYPVVFSPDGNTMTIDINFGPGYWHFVLEKQTSTNVEEPQQQLFSFFPNPANDLIQVNSEQVNDELILRDLTGRIIMNIQQPSQTEMLDVSNLPSGMYLLMIRSGEVISVEKLSIQ